MKNIHDILKRPIISERSMEASQDKKYTFEVAKEANKIEILREVEEIFGVKVASDTTINELGKYKRMGKGEGKRPDYKKAIVRLTPESKTIELFEGIL